MDKSKKEKKAPKDTAKEEPKPATGGKKGQKKTETKPKVKEAVVEEKVPVRMLEFYKTKVVPELSEKFKYKNQLQVPKLERICINVGVGLATQDPKLVEVIAKDVENIAGQKPVITKAKKSVSNFKLREGMKIGCKVTLRKSRMYEFLDKLINISIPRIRDFRGVPDKSFDGRGNYTLGIKEQVIFPEVNIDNINKLFGMDVTFVTTAKTDDEALELLKAFGMPFIKR
jgi:large subunit ribosomal protein L5